MPVSFLCSAISLSSSSSFSSCLSPFRFFHQAERPQAPALADVLALDYMPSVQIDAFLEMARFADDVLKGHVPQYPADRQGELPRLIIEAVLNAMRFGSPGK